MNMQAITKTTKSGQESVAALAAGADLVLMPADIKAAHGAIVAALDSGDLDRSEVERAAARAGALQWGLDARLAARGARREGRRGRPRPGARRRPAGAP